MHRRYHYKNNICNTWIKLISPNTRFKKNCYIHRQDAGDAYGSSKSWIYQKTKDFAKNIRKEWQEIKQGRTRKLDFHLESYFEVKLTIDQRKAGKIPMKFNIPILHKSPLELISLTLSLEIKKSFKIICQNIFPDHPECESGMSERIAWSINYFMQMIFRH